MVKDQEMKMDSMPVIKNQSVIILLSVLVKSFGINSEWHANDRLYSISDLRIMQTEILKSYPIYVNQKLETLQLVIVKGRTFSQTHLLSN